MAYILIVPTRLLTLQAVIESFCIFFFEIVYFIYIKILMCKAVLTFMRSRNFKTRNVNIALADQ